MFDINAVSVYKIVTNSVPAFLTSEEINLTIVHGLERELQGKNIKGKKIGVLAGSRGINNIQHITKTVVHILQKHGADVVILPSMGSHGGGTAEGQRSLLAHLGITETAMGAPILSTMEVTKIDDINGHPVYVNSPVLKLDGIVPINRIKAHTDFHGPYESGLVKMLVIGMGKRIQAENVHKHGFDGLSKIIPLVAKKILEHVPLLAAVGIVENKMDETAVIEVLNSDNLFNREQELLKLSKSMLPKIPVSNLDVLVVSEMGKNISGVGIDPNVTGRMRINGVIDEGYAPKRIVALDLTVESEGNAIGIGVADVISRRLYKKIDFEKTYINAISSSDLDRIFIPLVARTDAEAIKIASGLR